MVKLLIGTTELGYPKVTVEQTGLALLEQWGAAFGAAGFKPAAGGTWRRRLRDGVVLIATVVPLGETVRARVGVCSVYADDETHELCAFFCDAPGDFELFVVLPKPKRRAAK